jgi:hypothetical protein
VCRPLKSPEAGITRSPYPVQSESPGAAPGLRTLWTLRGTVGLRSTPIEHGVYCYIKYRDWIISAVDMLYLIQGNTFVVISLMGNFSSFAGSWLRIFTSTSSYCALHI